MKIYPIYKFALILLFSLLLMVPATAQEVAEGEELDNIVITFLGYISFDEEGNIYIDEYFLAPSGAIPPSALEEGQFVEVTGIFLNDDTFKLTEINVNVEEPVECDSTGVTDDTSDDCIPDDPACDSTGVTDDTSDDCIPDDPTCDSTGVTDDTSDDCIPDDPTCDSTGVTDDTSDDCIPDDPTCDSTGVTDDTSDDCAPQEEDSCNHPIAVRIGDAFDVDPCEVEAMHDDGNGFGNIAKAYLLAEAANQALLDALADGEEIDPELLIDAQAYLDLHDSGMGWGQIVKDSGVHPSDLAPGKLKKRAANDDDSDDTDDTDTTESTTQSVVNGNNGNNGNGNNGNNGNGNNGNNGNGNNGNNGNGNNGNNGNGNNGNNGNGNNGNNGNGNNGNGNNGKGKNGK